MYLSPANTVKVVVVTMEIAEIFQMVKVQVQDLFEFCMIFGSSIDIDY